MRQSTGSNNTIGTSPPQDNNIYTYMQIVNTHNIDTTAQTFHAKFYMTATWVQKMQNTQSSPLPAGFDFQISTDGTNWPSTIYHPTLSFDNAIDEVVDLKAQTLRVSRWRTYTPDANNNPQSANSMDQFAVIEWRASGATTLAFDAQLQNFPFDFQLLKITIASLDNQIRLRDDDRDNVASVIRKDYFFDRNFELMTSTGIDAAAAVNDDSRGLELIAKEDSFVINPTVSTNRKFATLTYIIPIQRISTTLVQQIGLSLSHISLVSLISFTALLYKPGNPRDRLQLIAIMALLLIAVSFRSSSSTNGVPMHAHHLSFSTLIVLSILGVAAIMTVFCDGYCESSQFLQSIESICYIFLATLWTLWNVFIFTDLHFLKSQREIKRMQRVLQSLDHEGRRNNKVDGDTEAERSGISKVLPFCGET